MVEGGSDGEGYFTSYVLDDFVMYRKPNIKPVAQEAVEGEKTSDKAIERGVKGQGEYELPSSVYTTVGLKNLCITSIELVMLIVVFDGVLKSGNKEEALHGVSFEMLSLGILSLRANTISTTRYGFNRTSVPRQRWTEEYGMSLENQRRSTNSIGKHSSGWHYL